jgi:hypothetical protein
MKVKDIYRKRFSHTICKVIGYYNGADYGVLSGNESDCNENILEMDVEYIGIDTINGTENCICIMVS